MSLIRGHAAVVAVLASALAACGNRDLPSFDFRADTRRTCVDPAAVAAFTACTAARSEKPCRDSGGRWAPLGPRQNWMCICPTGYAACPCSVSDHSFCSCIADHLNGPHGPICEGVTDYKCAPEWPYVGCHCTFNLTDIMIMCYD